MIQSLGNSATEMLRGVRYMVCLKHVKVPQKSLHYFVFVVACCCSCVIPFLERKEVGAQ